MTLVALVAVFAASCGQDELTIRCERRGDWPHTAGARWIARVIATAGYVRTECTGSAFVIDTGGPGRTGHDLYVWGWRGRVPAGYGARRVRISGIDVRRSRLRAVWQAGNRVVWVQAGPTTPRLLPLQRIGRLVRASLEVD